MLPIRTRAAAHLMQREGKNARLSFYEMGVKALTFSTHDRWIRSKYKAWTNALGSLLTKVSKF